MRDSYCSVALKDSSMIQSFCSAALKGQRHETFIQFSNLKGQRQETFILLKKVRANIGECQAKHFNVLAKLSLLK